MDTQNKGADPFANIFQQVTNISKAHAYDIISKQRDELVKENEQLKEQVEKLREALQWIEMKSYHKNEWKFMEEINIKANAALSTK